MSAFAPSLTLMVVLGSEPDEASVSVGQPSRRARRRVTALEHRAQFGQL